MESFILTCLQAQLIVGKIKKYNFSIQIKNDLILEIKKISPKECKIFLAEPNK